MPIHVAEPMFVTDKLAWGLHGYDREVLVWVPVTAFKYALRLRPKALADDALARDLAVKNWAVLELIGRDALAAGVAIKSSASKDWQVHYDIDRSAFARLFERYEAQVVR